MWYTVIEALHVQFTEHVPRGVCGKYLTINYLGTAALQGLRTQVVGVHNSSAHYITASIKRPLRS